MSYQSISPTLHSHAIAIIGGGFSGSLVAVQLMQQATTPLSILLLERHPQFGRGIAYSTTIDAHLLNVPAGKMSAFPDEPEHFLRWLRRSANPEATSATFAPRRVYGDYIQSILRNAEAAAPSWVRLVRIVDEAIALDTTSDTVTIYLSSGQRLQVDRVVLAVGNFPAALPAPLAEMPQRDRYVRDAWSAGAIADVQPDEPVLLVGTGLTMADVVVSLAAQGHRGPIYAASRHGLMPQRHTSDLSHPVSYPVFLDPDTASKTARGLLHRVRQEVRSAAAQGIAWQAVIDALRPVTQPLWQALPLTEQKRFLRHVKTYWEAHRHRIAAEVDQVLQRLMASGQLRYFSGRIQACRPLAASEVDASQSDLPGAEVVLRERHSGCLKTLRVRRIINCTGSNSDYRRLQHPLIASLQEQRLMRLSPLSLGIDTAASGALIDADGQVSRQLYTLGTPRKGDLWETTAVPELRQQAQNLAQELLRSLPVSAAATAADPAAPSLIFRQLFDRESCTYTYLIADAQQRIAVLVDPVLDRVERDLQVLRELGLRLSACLETHVHADHITGADRLRTLTGCQVVVPADATVVGYDRTIADDEVLHLGAVTIRAIATPGHTDSHLAYLVNDTHLLTGDALFIRGCGRTDLQGGDAGALYDAVMQKLFTLPDSTLVYPGHDYQGRTVSTIGEEKRWNPRFAGRDRAQFMVLMSNLKLPYPKKMNEAVPANKSCGARLMTSTLECASAHENESAQQPDLSTSATFSFHGMYI